MNDLRVSSKIPAVSALNEGPAPPGFYAKQPLRTVFFAGLVAETLALQLPLRTLAFLLLPRWTRPLSRWPFKRALFVSILRHFGYYRVLLGYFSSTVDKSTLPRLKKKAKATPVWIQPVHRQSGLTGEIKIMFDAGGCTTTRVPAYWYGEDHAATQGSRSARPGEKVVLFLHGGGYRELNASPTCPPTNNLYVTMKGAKMSGKPHAPTRALALEYRLTSIDAATFPAILADALAAWTHLVRELGFAPQDILLLGDSAGGNLCLALARYLRDERPLWDELGLARNSPVADGLILSSPWIDVAGTYVNAGPSSSGAKNAGTDYLCEMALIRARRMLVKGLPATALHSVWISSVTTARSLEDSLFDGFPRTICFYGGLEIFADEIRAFGHHFGGAADDKRAGPLKMIEEPDAVHDYLALPFTFKEEHRRASAAIAAWL